MKIIIVLLFCLMGCTQKGIETKPTNNPNFQVTFLFQHDGCRVYRFYDGDNRYFTNCDETSWTESCGEDCTRPMSIKGKR